MYAKESSSACEPVARVEDVHTLSRSDLRALVAEWTLTLKSDGLLPEKVLIIVKRLVREVVALHLSKYDGADVSHDRSALLTDASQCCLETYFALASGHGEGNARGVNCVARRSASRQLLLKLLVMRPDLASVTVASRLRITLRQLALFASGAELMPIDVQERLADFLMREEARLASRAQRLRLQIEAARRYQQGDVVRHMSGPPQMW